MYAPSSGIKRESKSKNAARKRINHDNNINLRRSLHQQKAGGKDRNGATQLAIDAISKNSHKE